MSIIDPGPRLDKYCFIYCGDDVCDCQRAPRYRRIPFQINPETETTDEKETAMNKWTFEILLPGGSTYSWLTSSQRFACPEDAATSMGEYAGLSAINGLIVSTRLKEIVPEPAEIPSLSTSAIESEDYEPPVKEGI